MRTKQISRLRNAEYYDIQQEFDELYKKSKKNCKFTDLLSIITREENLQNLANESDIPFQIIE